MQDSIVREITVKAKKENVFSAITDPKQIIQWFPDVIEGELKVGQQPVFTFTSENHKARIYVEALKPHDYFAYRWVPGGSVNNLSDVLKVPNTLVEFFLEDAKDGTKVTLKESGFASLPAEVAENSFKDNSGGWEYMMNRLEKMVNNA